MIWEKSRRIGATYADSYKTCRDRNLTDEARDLWFSSADESAALEYAIYCRRWCELMEIVTKQVTLEQEDSKGYKYNNYVIDFPNGSRVNCLTSNPRRFRSKGGDIVLDEFSHHDQPGLMLDAAQPSAMWGYQVRILSTHNGENSEFNKIIEICRQVQRGEITFEKADTLNYRWYHTPLNIAIEQGLAEKIYKLDHVDAEVREKLRKRCRALARNEDAWNQEYMCIPSAAASTLIPYDLYQSCEISDWSQSLVPHTAERRQYYLGADIGREKDLTVIWLWELVGDVLITRKVIKLYKTPYGAQLEQVSDILFNLNILRACIDATGIGDMLAETLQDRFGTHRVEKVKFTGPVKEHLASQMLGRFEDRRIRVPADRETREDFHGIKKTITQTGNIRFDAARTDAGHADRFWAAALGVEAASPAYVKPELFCLTG